MFERLRSRSLKEGRPGGAPAPPEKPGSLPLESWCLLSYAGEVRRGLCPLRRSLFSFYLLLLGPAGQVQAEKEQVRGKIKQFLGGASPLQTSPAGGAKRPTLCRETTRKWDRKQMLAEGRFAWTWLFLSAFLGATLSTALSLAGFSDQISFSVPLLVACLLLVSAHTFRFWRHRRGISRMRDAKTLRLAPVAPRPRYRSGFLLAILGITGILALAGLAFYLIYIFASPP